VPPLQTPFWQVLPWIQRFELVHAAPFAAAGLLHCPEVGSQVPAMWHWSEGLQTTPAQRSIQVPLWQTSPDGQTVPQAPQWLRSVFRLVSQPFAGFPSQSPQPGLQEATVQAPLLQPAVPLATLQTVPQAPQLFGSAEVLTQVPPQFVKPPLQVDPHVPPRQAAVALGSAGAGQTLLQAPQFLGSPARFMQVPLQQP
jgi:hypothetical protein